MKKAQSQIDSREKCTAHRKTRPCQEAIGTNKLNEKNNRRSYRYIDLPEKAQVQIDPPERIIGQTEKIQIHQPIRKSTDTNTLISKEYGSPENKTPLRSHANLKYSHRCSKILHTYHELEYLQKCGQLQIMKHQNFLALGECYLQLDPMLK